MADGYVRTIARDNRGTVALILALGLPVLIGGVVAAVEYASLTSRRASLQRAADAAALAAAQELRVAGAEDSRIENVATNVARASVGTGTDLDVQGKIIGERSGVRVDVTANVESVIGRILTLPSSDLRVSATAQLAGGAGKICVVSLETAGKAAIEMKDGAKLTANGCGVYANSRDARAVTVKDSALLSSSSLICSAGGFDGGSGNFNGRRLSDCPETPDPLASRREPTVGGGCRARNLKISGDAILFPGTYCDGFEIKDNADVFFMPGIYVIKDGKFVVKDRAAIYGRNVGFYFTGKDARFEFKDRARVNLGAPKDGPMSGILFFGERAAELSRQYRITSDLANTLIGTIYIPQGQFIVDATSPVADQSPWTAIVTRSLLLAAQPNLVLNSNYHSTDVPVPEGFATTGQVRLSN